MVTGRKREAKTEIGRLERSWQMNGPKREFHVAFHYEVATKSQLLEFLHQLALAASRHIGNGASAARSVDTAVLKRLVATRTEIISRFWCEAQPAATKN